MPDDRGLQPPPPGIGFATAEEWGPAGGQQVSAKGWLRCAWRCWRCGGELGRGVDGDGGIGGDGSGGSGGGIGSDEGEIASTRQGVGEGALG